MIRRNSVGWIFLIVVVCLSACGPTPETTPTLTPCPPIPLVAPQVFSPSGELVASLQPTFQWFYSEPCGPDSFTLEIAPEGDFNDPGLITEQTNGFQTTWTLTQTLQPSSLYQWRVYGVRSGSSGPISPAPWFWTGPICDASIPEIPELVDPILGEVVADASPPLDWSFPDIGCLPEGYQFQVSEQPDFQTTGLSGTGQGPWTNFETNVDFLQDCTDYFWRVAVLNNLVPGEYSHVETFSTDFQGTCGQVVMEMPEIYALGCIGSQSMMITFEFPEPPHDGFEARAEGNTYECELNPQRPLFLHCSGPRIDEVPMGLVELVEIESQEVVFSGEARFPNCDQPPCTGLGQEDCNAREDCKWMRGITGYGGFCVDN